MVLSCNTHRLRALAAISVAVLFLCADAPARITNFAGRVWQISERYGAPGPNWWTNQCVWVDTNGWLHLKITQIGTNWFSGEVQTTNSLGYGEYRWYVSGRVDDLDTNVVAGLFTYEYIPGGDNEVDIEFTKSFADDPRTNLHYTIQPYYTPGHQYQGAMNLTNTETTHRFIWNPGYIHWDSWYGHTPTPDTNNMLGSWTYVSNDVPVHSNEHCYINLWMFFGEDPVETNKLEMVIKDFIFIPPTNTLLYDEFNDGTMSNIWATFGDTSGGGLVETSDMFRVHPVNEDWTSLGYHTSNRLAWAADGLDYVFSASFRTGDVTTVSTNGTVDLWALQGFFSAPSTPYNYDTYWPSNAVTLKAGYDSSNGTLQVDFYTKTNWPQNWGNLRFRGMITNVAAYGDTNGLDLQFVLNMSNYIVRALYLSNAVPISTNFGESAGLHSLGSSLNQGYYIIGAQNETDGRGYVFWNRAWVQTMAPSYTSAPPPAVTNPPNVVEIGKDVTTWRYPLNTRYQKSRLQVLYLTNQVPLSGVITQLDIYVSGYPHIRMSNYTIRMQHTASNNLTANWITNGWTTVYQSNLQIGSVGWYSFQFTNSFVYDNRSNLLIDFSFRNNTREGLAYGYGRYSVTSGVKCLARSGNTTSDPLAWSGTDPGSGTSKDVYNTNLYLNVRLVFDATNGASQGSGDFAGWADEFNDGVASNIWGYVGNWDGAGFVEMDGNFRVTSGVNAWQTQGYITTNRLNWSDTNGWYVFSAVISTIRVDTAGNSEDLRTIISLCSEKENAWYVTNSVMLQGRYDNLADTLSLVFFTKTNWPSTDGNERFNGTISNVSRYLDGANRIDLRILLGQQQYSLRFSDAAGIPLPVATNSGTTGGNHNLGSKLYQAYWHIGSQNPDTNRGAVYWDRTAVFTSSPPQAAGFVTAVQTSTNGLGLVTITGTVFDAEGHVCRLGIEATTNGGSGWFRPWITAVAGTYPAAVASNQQHVQVVQIVLTNGGGVPVSNTLAITWDTQHPSNAVALAGTVVTNLRVRLTPDDLSLGGPAGTSAVFAVDNQPPSAVSASVVVEGGAAYTFDATLDASWSGFADPGSSLAGYYCALNNGGGTTSGTWAAASPASLGGAAWDSTNTVYVWARDMYGNIGAAAFDSIIVLSDGGDWDGDGMPNGWEISNEFAPDDSSDGVGDGDSDGYMNRDEYFWGTSPTNFSSKLLFEAGHSSGSDCLVQWSGSVGRLYCAYFSDGGFSNNMPWAPIASCSNVAGVDGLMIYTDESTAVEGRFYKLGVRFP